MTVRTCVDCQAVLTTQYAKYCSDHRWLHRGKPAKYVWTPEKDAFLKAKYDSRRRGRAAQIGRLWGWPHWVIKKRAQALGLARPWPADRRVWTTEEEAQIERYAGTRHPTWVARQLKRSLTSIVVKMRRLRLSRCPEGLNQLAVADAFGCSRDTVEKWLRLGWLHATHASAGKGERYGITDADLVAFIRAYPTAFDLRTVHQPWFLDLVLGGGATLPRDVPLLGALSNRRTITHARQQAFLASFQETGKALVSINALGLSRTTVYAWRRHDRLFALRFEDVRKRSTSRAV